MDSTSDSSTSEVTDSDDTIDEYTIRPFFQIFRVSMLAVGLLGNLLLLIFLIKHRMGSQISTIILRSQALVDGLLCFMAIILDFQGDNHWLVGIQFIDILVCRTWHSLAIYYSCVIYSVYLVVITSGERLLSLVYPLVYRRKTRGHGYSVLLLMFLWASVFNIPSFFEGYYQPGVNGSAANATCLYGSENYNSESLGFFIKVYSVFYLLFLLILPSLFTVGAYTKIIVTLRHNNKHLQEEVDVSKQTAAIKLTIATALITISFIICFCMDTSLYMMTSFGMMSEYWDTILDRVSTFMLSVNFCINPLVFFVVIAKFRRFVWMGLSCRYEKIRCGTRISGHIVTND